MRWSPERIRATTKTVEQSFVAFASCLDVVTADGEVRPLILNPAQRAVASALDRGSNVVVVKARQLGITTVCAAYLFWRSYCAQTPLNVVSYLHKQQVSQDVFKKVVGFYESIPAPIRRPLAVRTAKRIEFKSTKSVFSADTAGGKGSSRGSTLHLAHLSEFAFYDDPESVWANVLSSLNGNQVIVESTCKQYGDALHEMVDVMLKGQLPGSWELLFFPWHQHKDYRTDPPPTWSPTPADLEVMRKYGLDRAQAYWRYCKIIHLGPDTFKTEYPASLDELFEQRGGAYYSTEDLQNVTVFPTVDVHDWEIEPPIKGEQYGIGVDVSAGIGRDYSVAYVLNKRTRCPVYIYRSNETTPEMLARRLQHLAKYYNDALVLVESNSWGLPVLAGLRHLGGVRQWMRAGKSWTTTAQSKLMLHEELKAAIRKGEIARLDYGVVSELRALALPDSGQAPESVRGSRGHSDSAMALGLAYQCLKAIQTQGSFIDRLNAQHRIQQHKFANRAMMLPR